MVYPNIYQRVSGVPRCFKRGGGGGGGGVLIKQRGAKGEWL